MNDPLVCVRCGRLVRVSANDYDTFERMHYVCFHYQFEHDQRADVDADCGLSGCPSGSLPSSRAAAQDALHDIAEALRRPYDADPWRVEREQPGVMRLTRAGAVVKLVAVETTQA